MFPHTILGGMDCIIEKERIWIMLANRLNYGDTIGVVGVSNSLALNNRFDDFKKAEKFLITKGFKIKFGKYIKEDYLKI